MSSGPLSINKKAKPSVARQKNVRATFDSAQTNSHNSKHWATADALSPNAAIDHSVRDILRRRGRHECKNNSHAKGILDTIVDDTIGTGPRLQIPMSESKPSGFEKLADSVYREFIAWYEDRDINDSLRVARGSKIHSGECFLVSSNSRDGLVKYNPLLIEADQVRSSAFDASRDIVDGITTFKDGTPRFYHISKFHPGGDSRGFATEYEVNRVQASKVIHYFKKDRPGQLRGIPEITPALPLFAILRRWTLASLQSAETAANFAMVAYTDLPSITEPEDIESLETIDLERGLMTTMPEGWKLGQVKSEHPAIGHMEFKTAILSEVGRALNVPLNVAIGNSKDYNYASGRLDFQSYHRGIKVERKRIESVILNRVFSDWYEEARLVYGWPDLEGAKASRYFGIKWYWDGFGHADPQKESQAQNTNLQNKSTNYREVYSAQGKDWREEFDQSAEEQKYAESIGLDLQPINQKLQQSGEGAKNED